MAKKRPSIEKNKIKKTTNNTGALFGETNSETNKEPELNDYEAIKNYYLNHNYDFKKTKMCLAYLPPEIHKLLRQKAIVEEKSMSSIIADTIINEILNKDELVAAYKKGYKERNPTSRD